MTRTLANILLVLVAVPALALGADLPDKLTVSEANTLLTGLGIEVKEVREAPISGMWELVMERSGERSVAYLDHEKKHLVPGPVFDIASKTLVGGHSARPPRETKIDVASLPTAGSIVLGNPKGKKRLFVFTDPDCPFCAQLHWELEKLTYMEPELAIYVKMFPLKSHPKAYDKARVILGGKSVKMLDRAFAGEELPLPGPADPAEPVDDSIRLADSLGIGATPSMVFPDGLLVTGVKSATQLRSLLDSSL